MLIKEIFKKQIFKMKVLGLLQTSEKGIRYPDGQE
jgi:hypothetical protein